MLRICPMLRRGMLFIALCGLSQQLVAAEVSRADLVETLDLFATLDRVSGGEGERQANAYLKRKLTEYHVPFRTYEMQLYLSHPLSAEVEVLGPDGRTIEAINHAFSRSTPPGGVEGEVIYIGRNMTEDPFDAPLVDYEVLDVRDKIVLDDGYPAPYRAWATEQAGALAQIFINPDNQLHNMTVTTVWGSPTPETKHMVPTNPIVALRRPDGDNIRDRVASGETVRVRVKGEVDTRWRPTELVVAHIDGGSEAEKFVLVGGHLDSWHEGITDNATGNASMLEMARILHEERDKLRRSVRLAWWPGHSAGRYAGATWYADNLYADLRENAIVYMNIDSPGARSATLYRGTNMAELEDFNRANILRNSGQELERTGRVGKTADEAFTGIGLSSARVSKAIPAGSPDRGTADGSGGSWWWHARTDSRDKADEDLLIADTGLYIEMVKGFTVPELLPYDYADTADEMIVKLREISNYDTTDLIAKVERFRERARKLAAMQAREIDDHAAHNTGLIRIGRALNSVYYTKTGPYDHDTNELIPRFPGIARASELEALDSESDDARFLMVRLKREENRIVEGIDTATEVADLLLQ